MYKKKTDKRTINMFSFYSTMTLLIVDLNNNILKISGNEWTEIYKLSVEKA